jgi:hypothetical protein
MKGVNFITDETKNRRYAQIDLKGIANYNDEALEDLFDIIIAESRKEEKGIPWNEVKAELIKEGKINVPGNNKSRSKKRA